MTKFYIDFSCWEIEAKNDEDAFQKAREIMEISAKDNLFPTICTIEEVDHPNKKENDIEVE